MHHTCTQLNRAIFTDQNRPLHMWQHTISCDAQRKWSRHKVYPIASSSHSSVAFIGTGTLYKSSRLNVYRHEGCLWHRTMQTPLKVEKIRFSCAYNPTSAALSEESPGQMELVCKAHLGIKTCARWLYPPSKQPL